MYISGPIEKYLDDLAGKRPAPGGGSAAALGATIGVALMEMVVNYTVGNSKYKDVEKDFMALQVKLADSRAKLQTLVDEDAQIYDRLRKGRDEHKRDSEELERLYKEAAAVPFGVCKITSECLLLCQELVSHGNENLITDTAIAAIMLEGAFFSAKYNVYINLKYIKDFRYLETMHKFLSPLEEEMPRLKEEILHKCEEVISK